MIEIKLIDDEHKQDINIPNEPFLLNGKMAVTYTNHEWHYEIEHFNEKDVTSMCFPDENYNYDAMKDSIFIGAYEGDNCVGLAILQHSLTKYIYLYDLKVSQSHRRLGIASSLIQKAEKICIDQGYKGIYTQGQDNNLSACLFYIDYGFYIGGLDTNIYKGSAQEGKSDIIFYLDC